MHDKISKFINSDFEENIIPKLSEFIRIGNTSPAFNGSPDLALKAAKLLRDYVIDSKIKNCTAEIIQEANYTPLLFVSIKGTDSSNKTALCYGHLDKQPHLEGWTLGGPVDPVIIEDKLYGRGSTDDGYALFAYISAIKALQMLNINHPNIVIIIEACEESGSFDFNFYLDKLSDKIGNVDFVFCLDSGCGDYQHMWITSSLRGNVYLELTVEILKEQVHSGDGSGILPDSFRILRILLDRIEDSKTGEILIPELYSEIPKSHLEYAKTFANTIGNSLFTKYPIVSNLKPTDNDPFELIINKTWKPQLTVIGTDHDTLPNLPGSNVLRTKTTFGLSFRLPPLCDPRQAFTALKDVLLSKPPYNAKIYCSNERMMPGWANIKSSDKMLESINNSSNQFFKNKAIFQGEGGSIPVINEFQLRYPNAEIIISGIGGPQSNAHAVNESLDLPGVKKLICCMAKILSDCSNTK